MPKIKADGANPQGLLRKVPDEMQSFSDRAQRLKRTIRVASGLPALEVDKLVIELRELLKEGEVYLEHSRPELVAEGCFLYRELMDALEMDRKRGGTRLKNQLNVVFGLLRKGENHLLQMNKPAVPKAEARGQDRLDPKGGAVAAKPGGAATNQPALKKPAVIVPPAPAAPPKLPPDLMIHPGADKLAAKVDQLTPGFASLGPFEQHRLLKDIARGVDGIVSNLEIQGSPGECAAVAEQLTVLANTPTRALRLFDKATRHSMKTALTTLSQTSDPALADAAAQALRAMTPDFVQEGVTSAKATTLLAGSAVGNFVIHSNPYPEDEFCVDVKTADGVRHYDLQEKTAENGSILYTFDGEKVYKSVELLVEKDLKQRRGFAFLGEDPQVERAKEAQERFIQPGVKFDKLRIGDTKVSHIRGTEGHEYIISNTQAQGAFGKFRYAIDMDGNRWAVKEFRSRTTKARPKTHVTAMEEILKEIATMKKVGLTLTIRDCMNIDGKVYSVMPIMEGELGDVVNEVPRPKRKAVARSAMRQMAADLRRCHVRGLIHRDVKLANALWNVKGRVAVSDFGLAVDRPPRGEKHHDFAGTPPYMAPEMFDPAGYGMKVDSWSLGLSIADIHIDWWKSPFVAPEGVSLRSWADQNFAEYRRWRGRVSGKGAQANVVSLAAIAEGATTNKFDKYFGRLKKADPVLCEFILNKMLVINPTGRASMKEVEEFFSDLQSKGSDDERIVRGAFRTLVKESAEKEAVFELLEKERKFSKTR